MEGAIVLVILVIIVLFVIPIVIAASSSSKISRVSDDMLAVKAYLKRLHESMQNESGDSSAGVVAGEIRELKDRIDALSALIKENNAAGGKASSASAWQRPDVAAPVTIADRQPVADPEPFPEASPVQPEPIVPPVEETEAADVHSVPPHSEPEPEPEIIYATGMPEPEHETVTPVPENIPAGNPLPSHPGVSPLQRRKTDFEQFIGEKLISIVGITILVLGIFFSVKWAIDRHLISDAGKVMIGIASGTILLGVAHKLAKNYRAFSSILAGGGIAVLYFSVYEAYQAYHLLPQAAAFGVMVFITLITVILSVVYDKKELAIIAIAGGFGTPFFVSNGAGNYQVLFTYLLILNVGMFLLASFKKWNVVNIICYILTAFIFGGWVSASFDAAGSGQASGGMLFASLFFLTFFGMHIVYNLRHRARFGYTEILLLLSNSFIYLGFGLYFLHFISKGSYQGVFALSLAAFNFVFAYIFYKRKNIDRNLVFLLIGLVLTFLSLAAPLQLDGNYITLFWACELVIVYWMGTRTGIELLKNASIVVLVLTLVSLFMDWNAGYFSTYISVMPVLFNKTFITAAVTGLGVLFTRKLLQKDDATHLVWGSLPKTDYVRALAFLLVAVTYMALHLEVRYQSLARTGRIAFEHMMLWNFHIVFMVALGLVVLKGRSDQWKKVAMVLLAASLLFYPLSSFNVTQLRNEALLTGYKGLFLAHYLIPVAVGIGIAMLVNFVNRRYCKTEIQYTIMAWGATAIVVYTLSAEAVHLWVMAAYEKGLFIPDLAGRACKVALPIIWSLCSLLLMFIGMRTRNKMLRIISLTLFSLTILKLFLYDISNVGQGGKIAAFVILGVILLIVSFMYQKIKGLFIEDDGQDAEPPAPDSN